MLFEQFAHDLRYAWRGLTHSRAFVASTVLTLAAGMGLVLVVFAIFNAYVLRPFAVQDPYSLHLVGWRAQEASGSTFRWRDYEDFRGRTDLFAGAIAESRRTVTTRGRQMSVGFVSGNYFDSLGARVALGRGLVDTDARTPDSEPVVVLTDESWSRLFDRDPTVIGRELDVNGVPLVVVGVMAPEFSGMDEVPRDAWVPITMFRALLGENPFDPGERRVQVTVRLRHDVTAARAQAAVALEPFETRVPGRRDPVRAELLQRATPVRMTWSGLALLSPVFIAFGLVLVAASANASNVMLARANARHREIGIRLSIGASRGRIVRQLVTEGLLLALLAGAGGLALAAMLRRLGTVLMVAMLPPTIAARVRFVPLDFDLRVVLFTCLLAGAVTVLFALLPALQATRVTLTDALRGQLTGAIRSGTLRSLLITGQVTVSLVLLDRRDDDPQERRHDSGDRSRDADRGRDLGAREPRQQGAVPQQLRGAGRRRRRWARWRWRAAVRCLARRRGCRCGSLRACTFQATPSCRRITSTCSASRSSVGADSPSRKRRRRRR